MNIEQIKHTASFVRKNYETTRAKFVAGIDKDPSYTLAWGESFFQETAVASLWAQIENYLESPEVTVEAIAKELLYRITHARTPSSTSRSSNLMEMAKQEAERQVYRTLTGNAF